MQSSSFLKLLICAAIVVLAAVAWPLRNAWFSTDDYTMLALARHTPNPALFFIADPFSNYMYRPAGMLLWWLTSGLFGTTPAGHYATNLLIHAGIAAGLGALVRQATGRSLLAACSALMFALHPGMLKTVAWLSDRFELLATLCILWSLVAAGRALKSQRGWWLVMVLAAIAAFSKEIAFVLLPALALRLWGAPALSRRGAIVLLAVAAVPFVLVAAAHQFLLADMSTQLNLSHPLAGVWLGAKGWLMNLPDALAGRPLADPAALTIGVVLGTLLLAMPALARAGRIDWRWAAIAALFILGPMLLQAPVFQLVLVVDEPLSIFVNFRFYYLAGIGSLLALSLVVGALGGSVVTRRIGIVAAILLSASFGLRAHADMRAWANGTNVQRRVVEAATAVALTFDRHGPCTVFLLDVPDYIPEFPIVSDAAIKSALPPNHPALGCIFVTERSPTRNFTAGAPCDDAAWLPFAPRIKGNSPVKAMRFGDLCIHQFAELPTKLRAQSPQPHVFRWRGKDFQPDYPLAPARSTTSP